MISRCAAQNIGLSEIVILSLCRTFALDMDLWSRVGRQGMRVVVGQGSVRLCRGEDGCLWFLSWRADAK